MRVYGTYDWIAPPPAVRAVVKNHFREQIKLRRRKARWSFRLESLFTPRRTLALTGAVAFLAILVMGFVLLSLLTESQTLYATMTDLAGPIEVQAAGNPQWQQLADRTELRAGDRIRTGIAAKATLHFPDDSIAELGENAQLAILQLTAADEHGGQVVVLHQYLGRTEYNIEHQDPDNSWFEIATSSATVTVVGTKFTVEVTEHQSTLVSVLEGVVEISGQDSALLLEKGQIASVLPQSEPVFGILTGASSQPCRPAQGTERDNSCFTGNDESGSDPSPGAALPQLVVPAATPTPDSILTGPPTSMPTATLAGEAAITATPPKGTDTPQPSATPFYDATATALASLTATPTSPPPTDPPAQPTSMPAQPTSPPPTSPPDTPTPPPPPTSTPVPPTPTPVPPTSTSMPPTATPLPPTPTPPPYP